MQSPDIGYRFLAVTCFMSDVLQKERHFLVLLKGLYFSLAKKACFCSKASPANPRLCSSLEVQGLKPARVEHILSCLASFPFYLSRPLVAGQCERCQTTCQGWSHFERTALGTLLGCICEGDKIND